MLRWILETLLMSQWALAVVTVALIDLVGCRRRGMAVGGINVCLTANLVSLSCSGRDIVCSFSRASAEASESSRIMAVRQPGIWCQTETVCRLSLLAFSLPLAGGRVQSCLVLSSSSCFLLGLIPEYWGMRVCSQGKLWWAAVVVLIWV